MCREWNILERVIKRAEDYNHLYLWELRRQPCDEIDKGGINEKDAILRIVDDVDDLFFE